MKPSSGRIGRTAALAATVVFGVAIAAWPGAAAHAQSSLATIDGTPEIDASIAARNWSAALAELDARVASHPRDAQAKFKRGTVLAHLNRDDEAVRQFVELTQTYPELPEPYNNLAALYAKAGRYEEARVALETAVKASPGYGLAYENLGDLYLRLAAESYKRAQTLGRTSATSKQRLADIQSIVAAPQPAAQTRKSAAARSNATPAVQVPATQLLGIGPSSTLPTSPYVAPSR